MVSFIPSEKYLQNLEITFRTAFLMILFTLTLSYFLMAQQQYNWCDVNFEEVEGEGVFRNFDQIVDELDHRQADFKVGLRRQRVFDALVKLIGF